MSFQEHPSGQKNAREKLREVSLIGLAANLEDPLDHRAIGKLSIIVEELKSMNATRTQQRRDSRALRRYIE